MADHNFQSKHVVLAPHNNEVAEINNYILQYIPEKERICLSADTINDLTGANLIPVEHLNLLKPND